MRQEEALDGAVEDDDLYLLVGFERGDDLIQLRNVFRTKDIQRRMIKCHAPVRWRPSLETNLSCHIAHVCLQNQDYGLSFGDGQMRGAPPAPNCRM